MQYLRQSNLPRLPEEALTALEMKFTEEEFYKALSLMTPGKAPGPDGYTIKIF